MDGGEEEERGWWVCVYVMGCDGGFDGGSARELRPLHFLCPLPFFLFVLLFLFVLAFGKS